MTVAPSIAASALYHPPARGMRYSGITLELEHPGRFDKKQLCDGSSSYVLADATKPLGISRYTLDIRTRAETRPYLPGTKVVVLAGASQLNKLGYNENRINTLRGAPFLVDGIIYLPTYHPQQAADRKDYEKSFNPYLLARDGSGVGDEDSGEEETDEAADINVKDIGKTSRRNFRFWFISDISKAYDIAKSGYRPNTVQYKLHQPSAAIIAELHAAGTPGREEFFFDIECERESGRITCFAFSYDEHTIWSVPILNYDKELYYELDATCAIFRALAAAFAQCRRVVLHNAQFDLFILLWRYHIPPPKQRVIYDTMLGQARSNVDIEKSLGHCISLHTHQPYHKDEGAVNPSNAEQYKQYLLYNCKDVEGTALVYRGQQRVAALDAGLAASITQANSLVRPMLLKSFRGLKLDSEQLCQKIDHLNKRGTWITENILAPLAGGPINSKSPQQVADLLYTKFELPKSTDPTISLTGKGALYKLALKYPLPILPFLHQARRSFREAGHLSSKLWRTSHTTCYYAIPGTKTFRLSSRKLLGTFGTNLQNWSKKMRQLVIAGKGFKLIQVDQAGAEALIVAYLAPAGRYRDLFIHKVSPHVYFGLFAFPEVWKAELGYDITYLHNYSIAEVKADPRWSEISRCIKATDNNPPARRYYYFQKQINHSSNYGIGEHKFALNLLEKSEGEVALPVAECARLLGIYHSLYPEIQKGFQAYVLQQLRSFKLLRNLFGYPRRFYGDIEDHSIQKDALSWIAQSTVGCITSLADASLQACIDTGEIDFMEIWQNNHDSLLVRVPETEVRRAIPIIQQAMNIEMVNHRGEKFAMRSEASVGDNWYDMEEYKTV